MATIYYAQDADPSCIQGKTIGIIGYGSQGRAHALNLKDEGLKVIIGLYQGSGSWPKAEADGFRVATTAEVAAEADIIVMLLPDTSQAEVYRREIAPHLMAGKSLVFAHGFTIHYKTVVPPGSLVLGSPAKVKRPLNEEEIKGIRNSAAHYVQDINAYKLSGK